MLTIDDVGSYQITVKLNDDGPLPRFETEITFSMEIEYNPMPEEEL